MPTRRSLPTLLVLATALAPARAGTEDRDNRDPTAAAWAVNISVATMQSIIAQGNRVVDLEVVQTSPTLLTISYVPNSGSFAKTWWWAVDYTPADLGTLVAKNQARITDLEVYSIGGAVRMAALMELNTGSASKAWWWYYGTTTAYIYSQVSTLGARVVDLESYVDGSTTRYAAVLLHNSGAEAKSWWSYLNVTASYVESRLAAHGARIWDIERIGSDRYDVTMVKFSGEYEWHFYGLTATDVTNVLMQWGGRLIDVEQYGSRFDIVLANSSNALSRRVCDQMLARSDGFMGTYLRRVTTLLSYDLAYINSDRRFEPASTLKMLHHVHAMRDVLAQNIALGSNLTVNTTTSQANSCPYATTPFARTLQQVLEGMMRNSDNALTKVVTDRYGMPALNATASALGMADTKVNHHIGCGSPANTTTLVDLGRLHERVIKGWLGSERETFYQIFAAGFYGTYYAEGYLKGVIDEEAVKVGLTTSQRSSFVAGMRVLGKKGGYRVASGAHRAWAAYVSLPVWVNGGVSHREYVTGAFVNDGSDEAKAIDAAATGAAEVLRDEIHSAMLTLKNHVFGSITSFGASCIGSMPTGYVHTATGTPELGQKMTYEARATQRRGSTKGMLYIGGSKNQWGRTPLPLELLFLDAKGCFLRVSPDIPLPVPVANGIVTVSGTIPVDKALLGVELHTQFLIVDPGANPAGVIATNGVTTSIGGQQ